MRGQMTDKAQKIGDAFFKRKFSFTELRLIPYIQYLMCNEQKIDPRKINPEEREVLSIWRKEGHIEGGASGLAVTKEFWDFMCEVLFETYVKGAYPEYKVEA